MDMRIRLLGLAVASILAVALVALGSVRVFACRCGAVPDADAMAAAHVAFEGSVTAELVHSRPSGAPATYAVMVDEPLKGPIERGPVMLSALENPRGCGIEFVVGQRWIIFATVLDATTLTTTACSGSHLADQQELTVNASPSADTGLPPQLLVAVGVVVALVAVSAWAFGFLRARRLT